MTAQLMKNTRRHSTRRTGAGIVEFAILTPVMLAMLLGIIDFGMLGRSTLTVSNAAREGARAASLGQPTATIRSRILNSAVPPLRVDAGGNLTNGSILMQHAVVPPATSTSSPYVEPTYGAFPADVGTSPNQKNGVPVGNNVKITITYNHRSMTGLFNRTVVVPVAMLRES